MGQKMCPLTAITPKGPVTVACGEVECGWWHPALGQCSVLILAHHMVLLHSRLWDIVDRLPGGQ